MLYKNLTNTTKTFYGVTFKPSETKEVPGPINHIKFVQVSESSKTEQTNHSAVLPKSKVEDKTKNQNVTNKKEAITDGTDSD